MKSACHSTKFSRSFSELVRRRRFFRHCSKKFFKMATRFLSTPLPYRSIFMMPKNPKLYFDWKGCSPVQQRRSPQKFIMDGWSKRTCQYQNMIFHAWLLWRRRNEFWRVIVRSIPMPTGLMSKWSCLTLAADSHYEQRTIFLILRNCYRGGWPTVPWHTKISILRSMRIAVRTQPHCCRTSCERCTTLVFS